MLGVLAASTMLNIAYLLPIPLRGFFAVPRPASVTRAEAPWALLAPLLLTAALSVAWFFAVGPVIDRLLLIEGVGP